MDCIYIAPLSKALPYSVTRIEPVLYSSLVTRLPATQLDIVAIGTVGIRRRGGNCNAVNGALCTLQAFLWLAERWGITECYRLLWYSELSRLVLYFLAPFVFLTTRKCFTSCACYSRCLGLVFALLLLCKMSLRQSSVKSAIQTNWI